MSIPTKLLLLTVATLMYACAAPINQKTASNYYEAGQTALQHGDFEHALEMFSRAMTNVRLGKMGLEAEGDVWKKLGVTYGNMCRYDESVDAFVEAIAAYAKQFPDDSSRTFGARMEIAQLSYDTGRYEASVSYYDDAFPYWPAGMREVDPAGYAAILVDYADALERTDKGDRASKVRAEISELKESKSIVSLIESSDYVRYPENCK